MNRSPATAGFPWSLVLFVVASSLGVSFASQSSVEEKRQLVVLSWSDYVDPDLIAAFEKKTGARVKLVYYETDELKDDLLIATDGTGYDVVVTAGHSMRPYLRRNWVARLSTREVPNLKHLDPRWIDADPELKGYGVPYFWGTLGIAYRKDLVPEKISSWRQLFQPASYLRGKIVMLKDSRECIGLALKSLGYPFNSAEPRHYEEVERLLRLQKPFVREYSYISWTEDSFLITGDVLMAMIYNGDGLKLSKIDPRIEYVVPEEGTFVWLDYTIVMEASQNKSLAYAFIHFLNEPRNAARNASYVCFATPNKGAEKYLPAEFLQNEILYPGKAVLSRSEFYQELPASIRQKRNQIFSAIAN